MNMTSLGFPSVMDKWVYQDHLVTKHILIDSKLALQVERLEALSPRRLNNECAQPKLHLCHRGMAFSRPSSE